MNKKVIYETKWVQRNKDKEYPHGWEFDAPLVIFSPNSDPTWCNDYCKRYLSDEEFECIGAVPRSLLNPFDVETDEFLNHLINADESEDKKIYTEYEVHFYDWPEMKVWAINDLQAGILAMAHVIHDKGAGFQISYITSGRTGLQIPWSMND